ncbi:MAG: PHP domain-containing protein [Elusimicrobiota bacterium]
MKKVDLHLHSTLSDGKLTPVELIKQAKKKNLKAVAITDHDITEGIESAIRYGAKTGIEVIPGIELSCEYKSTEVHLLGYFINWENRWFQSKLKVLQKARERRAYHILNKLQNIGVNIDEQMLFAQAGSGAIGRMHFARCLVKIGEVKTVREAFREYLGKNCPAFVRKLRLTPVEALNMIHRVAGISVLAHPSFGVSHKNFIRRLARLGLSGIEIYHPHVSEEEQKKFKATAYELGLFVTGGSDSHGMRPEENPVGSMEVEYSAVENMKKALQKVELKNRIILNLQSQKSTFKTREVKKSV